MLKNLTYRAEEVKIFNFFVYLKYKIMHENFKKKNLEFETYPKSFLFKPGCKFELVRFDPGSKFILVPN